MNFQLSSSQPKHKWQIADQQQEIQNSMNELRKGIRSNVTEKVNGFNKFFENSNNNTNQKMHTETATNNSYMNFGNSQKEQNQQQQQQQHQYSPSRRLFDKINYDNIGQQQQQSQQQQQQQQHTQLSSHQQYSPLKVSHKFYSPRAIPSFDNLTKNLRDHSAGKNNQQQQQQQPYFKNEKTTLANTLWGDAPQSNTQQKFYTSSQHERSYQQQPSNPSTGSPTRISQVQKSIESLGQKSQLQQQQQQQQSSYQNGSRSLFDISQRKMSVQTSPHAKSNLLSEMDFFKKRDPKQEKSNQSSVSGLQSKIQSQQQSTSLFSEKKKDILSESFNLKSNGGVFSTKNQSQQSPRKLSTGSFSNFNSTSTGIKRSSLNPSNSIILQTSATPLRRSIERTNYSSTGLGLSFTSSSQSNNQNSRKLVDRVPISKITEIRSHVENATSSELSSLPSTYVEELTRLAASITKALKNTKFYERGFY